MPRRTRPLRCSFNSARSSTVYFLIFTLILSFCSQTAARNLLSHNTTSGIVVHRALKNVDGPALGLHRSGRIVADLPPQVEHKRSHRDDDDKEDQNETTTADPSPSATRTTVEHSSSTTATATVGTDIVVATPTVVEVLIPTPFDTSLNTNNLTAEGCPAFFNGFINDVAFKNCIPISSYLKSSSGFFQIMRSFVRLTRLLDMACAAPSLACTSLMNDLANRIVEDDACGADYRRGNPLVVMARNGFLAYPYVRDATCLKNPDTDNFCFADAVANSSSPDDATPYYLAIGLAYPGGSRPTCNECLQATMQIYGEAAKHSEQPVASIYNSAAEQINIGCGPSFVKEATTTSGSPTLLQYSTRDARSRISFVLKYYALPFIIGVLLLHSNNI
ncbi:hypothetical protein VTO42DRAFT_2672 [Malbranchea cinnamomea]